MIVRVMGEGQFRVDDGLSDRLNEHDRRAADALERGDEDGLRRELRELAELVRGSGERLPSDELSPSDGIVPPVDVSLEEARALLTGEGLIPDPAA